MMVQSRNAAADTTSQRNIGLHHRPRRRLHAFIVLVIGALFITVCVSIFLVYWVDQYTSSTQGQQHQESLRWGKPATTRNEDDPRAVSPPPPIVAHHPPRNHQGGSALLLKTNQTQASSRVKKQQQQQVKHYVTANNETTTTATHHDDQHDVTTTRGIELSAVVMFRVDFKNDLLKFSRDEVKQWMSYMSYAGVQHFYIYDNCRLDYECQIWLQVDPRVTYRRHHVLQYQEAQISAYIHHFNNNQKREKKKSSQYEIILDIDEYPFMPKDTKEGFLLRFARHALQNEDQTLLQTIFFVGKNETTHPYRVMRYYHREQNVINVGRTKPLYKPNMVDPDRRNQDKTWMIHWLTMLNTSKTYVKKNDPKDDSVTRIKADPSIIRLNHYWCERGKYSHEHVFDDSIKNIIEKIL